MTKQIQNGEKRLCLKCTFFCYSKHKICLYVNTVAIGPISDEQVVYCHKSISPSRTLDLKTLDTFGNCQRPVFSLGASQQYAQNSNPVKIWTQLVSKLRNNNGRKNTLVTQGRVLSDAWFKHFNTLLKNYVTSERAISHNVLYYQQLSFTCYQVHFFC